MSPIAPVLTAFTVQYRCQGHKGTIPAYIILTLSLRQRLSRSSARPASVKLEAPNDESRERTIIFPILPYAFPSGFRLLLIALTIKHNTRPRFKLKNACLAVLTREQHSSEMNLVDNKPNISDIHFTAISHRRTSTTSTGASSLLVNIPMVIWRPSCRRFSRLSFPFTWDT